MKKMLFVLSPLVPAAVMTASLPLAACGTAKKTSGAQVHVTVGENGSLDGGETEFRLPFLQMFKDFKWRLPHLIPNQGYEVDGWYYNGTKLTDYVELGASGSDIKIEGRFVIRSTFRIFLYNIAPKTAPVHLLSKDTVTPKQDATIVLGVDSIARWILPEYITISIANKIVPRSECTFNIEIKKLTIIIPSKYVVDDICIQAGQGDKPYEDFQLDVYEPGTETSPSYLTCRNEINFVKDALYRFRIPLSFFPTLPEDITWAHGSIFSYQDSNLTWLKYYDEVIFGMLGPSEVGRELSRNEYAIQPECTSDNLLDGNFQITNLGLIDRDNTIVVAINPKVMMAHAHIRFFVK